MAINRVLVLSFFWLVASTLFMSGAVCGEEPNPEEDFYVVQQPSEDDAEDQASKQDEDAEDSESGPKAIVPNSYVKSEVDRQLKGTGLEFSPYSPGEVWPIESYYRTQEEYPQEEPIVLMPDEEEQQRDENEKEKGENDNE